jgi:hypothetical protein
VTLWKIRYAHLQITAATHNCKCSRSKNAYKTQRLAHEPGKAAEFFEATHGGLDMVAVCRGWRAAVNLLPIRTIPVTRGLKPAFTTCVKKPGKRPGYFAFCSTSSSRKRIGMETGGNSMVLELELPFLKELMDPSSFHLH